MQTEGWQAVAQMITSFSSNLWRMLKCICGCMRLVDGDAGALGGASVFGLLTFDAYN